ncbi:putative tricarboxylate transport protein [Aspergillus heteromorphus CBS 117.55]|uniref:Putative tricarboxylate transport protein n=1 Tax=Aspergillus heteromorphus CBS 117.55 TaxID=1448321 RepID=A0A317WVV4_9EURO|nr:putative tricarboxylate transport protein [Aspergillus heteromorphus CBS 117.55]PWY90225.1 putative tricarboxylate transport protein [Aspergillus heteromorphus CBS 117.55]
MAATHLSPPHNERLPPPKDKVLLFILALTHHSAHPPLVSLLAGGMAGGVEAATTYPFEFAKTRLQLGDRAAPRNPVHLLRQVVATDGLGALYTGCSSLVVGTMLKAGVRFLCFDAIKNRLVDDAGRLSPAHGILAGMVAGGFESVLAVTPTERIKTALIDDAKGPRKARGALHGTYMLVSQQGLRGLYRGLIPTTVKQSATSAVRMGSYNWLKETGKDYAIPVNGVTTFLMGSLAGTITVYATQPFDTVKTRVQGMGQPGMSQAMAELLREEGVRGFWRGSTMRLGRLVLSGGIVFAAYEQFAAVLAPVLSSRSLS